MQNIQLILALTHFLLSILICHSITIYVDQTSLNDDCSKSSVSDPCNNFTGALDMIITNTKIHITPGSYVLPPSSRYTFVSVDDVYLIVHGVGDVVIDCNGDDSGLAFVQSKNIFLIGITLLGCGIEQNSTALNLSAKIDSEFSFLPVFVGLYFEECSSVALLHVTIRNSTGVGVQLYSTHGNVEIINCTFSDNTPVNNRWGGGLYIEFPFCKPGNDSCAQQDTSSVDISSVSDSNYVIKNCTFTNNIANDPEKHLLVLAYRYRHNPTGRGGGLSIFFKGNATNNTFKIDNCVFQNNVAVYGGGIYMEMQDSTNKNAIVVTNSVFINNHATKDGGGILVSYLFLKDLTGDEVIESDIRLIDVVFENNVAGFSGTYLGKGGGISYTSTQQSNPDESIANKFSIIRSCFCRNNGFVGSALQISSYIIADSGFLYPVFISDITVIQNTIVVHTDNIARPVGSGALYISNVPVRFLTSGTFTENNGSALAVFNSKLSVMSNTLFEFENNTGYDGGALLLHSSSVMILYENVSVSFYGNKALNRGGAIFANYIGPFIGIESQSCFIQYHNVKIKPSNWNIKFKFRYNSALIGDSIYASSLLPCILGSPFGVIDKSRNEELLNDAFCWNDVSDIWDYSDNNTVEECKRNIGTDMHFNQTSSPLMLNVTPGNITTMNLFGINEQGNKITSNFILRVYSSDDNDKDLVDPDYTYISDNSIRLKNPENVNSTVIHLETVGQEVKMMTDVNINFLECPFGFHLQDGVCVCSGKFGGVLNCNESFFTASLLRGYWIGYSTCMESDDTVVVSHCKYCNYESVVDGYYELNKSRDEITKGLCKNNRDGHICSSCKSGYAPAINIDTNECVKCNSSDHKIWGAVLFVAIDVLLPLFFLLALYIMDVPLTNGLLHGPIFFAQMITTVISLDADDIIQYSDIAGKFDQYFENFYMTIYNFFNLEFFMFLQTVCIGLPKFAHVISLQYIAALLPLILVILIGICIYLSDRTSRSEMEHRIKQYVKTHCTNLTNILATCIMLSYTRVAVISCFLLTPISLVSSNGDFGDYKHSVLYVDGSICYPSRDFYPYLAVSLLVTAIFLIPTPLFLVVFRSRNAGGNSKLFYNLLDQFQRQFRHGLDDFQNSRFAAAIRPNCEGKEEESVCCNPCTVCGKPLMSNHTNYEYECCTEAQCCRYYQMKSHCCPFVINTSCSLYDYRWLSGGMFVLRILLIIPYLFAFTTLIRYCLQLTICMFAGIIVLIFKPYKPKLYKHVDCNRVEAFSLLNLAFILSLCIYQYHYSTTKGATLSIWVYVIQCILVVIPFIWIVCVYCVLVKERHIERYDKYIKPCVMFCCGRPDMVRRIDNDLSQSLVTDEPSGSSHGSKRSVRLTDRSRSIGSRSIDSTAPRNKSEYTQL